MAKLIKALKLLEESVAKVDEDGYLDSTHPLVENVEYLAVEMLITRTGKLNIENMEILDNMGYRTFPVERDRFGWLIGGIQTSIGIVTYG